MAMTFSGLAAATIGFVGHGPLLLILLVGALWGFWVVAYSAQFSAVVTEVAEQRYVGTAVTLQLAGPIVGIAAMARLRVITASRP